jgi:hypothetical protein
VLRLLEKYKYDAPGWRLFISFEKMMSLDSWIKEVSKKCKNQVGIYFMSLNEIFFNVS